MDLDIAKRIRDRRKELGLTMKEVSQKSGIPLSTISGWEQGYVTTMKHTNVKALAKALDLSPLYILGWDDEDEVISPLIQKVPTTKTVPVIGEIAAGLPINAEENYDGTAEVPDSVDADFCLRVRGDSMINARIFNGDLVFIKQQPVVNNGEIAAVLIDGEATLKRVYTYENRIELRPENPTYTVMNFEGSDLDQVRILGKAITFMSKVV